VLCRILGRSNKLADAQWNSLYGRRAVLEHLQKFFNHCTAEWLWIDVLAIPEVYKDMSEVEKEKTEEVRV
jgi:hypothetical protein